MSLELDTVHRAVLELAGELVDAFVDPKRGRLRSEPHAIYKKHLQAYARARKISPIQAKEEFREALNYLRDEMIL